MKTEIVKRIYIKMLKFKIKLDEYVNKMKLNKTFTKKMQIAEDLNGIIVADNVVVALRSNGNSETWNKEAELNTFGFWEKFDWQAWLEDWKRRLLDFIGSGERWDVWEGAQAGFESLNLMTEAIVKEKNIAFCWRNWNGRFRSSRSLRAWEFWVKLNLCWIEVEFCFEAESVKELDLNK